MRSYALVVFYVVFNFEFSCQAKSCESRVTSTDHVLTSVSVNELD
jgi:hypothetical protein